jgi:adenylate cyclase
MTNEVKLQRRLAAILVADVAGYSGLMQRNEEAVHRRWQRYLGRAGELAATHEGRVVKTTGDGFIAEFASVVEAVRAAAAWLNEIGRLESLLGEEERIQVRMGLHLGDVIVGQDGDLFGDGVNVAARLEKYAPPGAICVDEATRTHLTGKIDLEISPLGAQRLKNIAEPLQLWVIHMRAGAVRRRLRLTRVAAALLFGIAVVAAGSLFVASRTPGLSLFTTSTSPTRDEARPSASTLSIVVLPFTSASTDRDDEIFGDALTEDLVTDLSRIADAFVISANTSFTLKGKTANPREIAQELGVSYALSGTVRRSGDQIQVTSTLLDAATGAVLWSERYDRTRADIYSLQQQLTGQIARTLNLQLKEAASRKAARGAPADLQAQDYAVRAWAELWTKPQSKQTNDAALDFIEKALALDRNNADALALKTYAFARAARYGWLPGKPQDLAAEAIALGERAVSLDTRDADAYFALAFAISAIGDLDRSLDLYGKAVELNPNHAPSYANYGFTLILKGKPDEASRWIERALSISPRDPLVPIWRSMLSLAAILEGKSELALSIANAVNAANPNHPTPYLHAAVALRRLGRPAEAADKMARHQRIRPDWTIAKQMESSKGSPAYDKLTEPFLQDLRALGLPAG